MIGFTFFIGSKMSKVTFDGNSRKDFLLGFQKRKEERRAKTKVLTELKKQRILKSAKKEKLLDEKQIDDEIFEEEIIEEAKIKEYQGQDQNDENITVKVEPIVFHKEKKEHVPPTDYKPAPVEMTTKEKVEKLVQKELKKGKAPKKKPHCRKASKKLQKLRAKVTSNIQKKKQKKSAKEKRKSKGK